VTVDRVLADFLDQHSMIGVDTSPFIYFVEEHPRYFAATTELFDAIDRHVVAAVTSMVTMLEVLVRPLREGRIDLVDAIYAVAPRHPHIDWMPLSLPIAQRGAQLRAQYNMRTPDAIQVATALHAGASGFVTNDRRLSRVTELDVFVLDDALRLPRT
jgi:predicted nucleic acid-binding protein